MASVKIVKTTSRGSSVVPYEMTAARPKEYKVRKSSTGMQASVDPFFIGDGFASLADFSNTQGRRGPETRMLNTGPATTQILHAYVARKRSRYAVLTSPFAKKGIDTLVNNAVGSGHQLISEAPDPEFKKQVENLWRDWGRVADTTGSLPFSGLEELTYRSMLEGGDCFVRFRVRRMGDGLPVPLQLQVIEAEQCPLFKNEKVGQQNIIGGIQFSLLGNPVIYHMYSSHPGDLFADQSGVVDTVPVPADQVLHIHEVKRPGDVRGLPALSQVLIKLSDLDRYMDAELYRKKAASLIVGFLEEPFDQQSNNPLLTGKKPEDKEEIEVEEMEPGGWVFLPPGFKASLTSPPDVGANFETFLKTQLQMVAAALGLPLEFVTGDLTDISDRTLRAAMLEFKRRIQAQQKNIIIHQFCQPVFDRFFDTALLSGALTIPAGMDERDARKVRWISDPWRHLHPEQEIRAEVMEIDNGLKSRSEALMERGKDPGDFDIKVAEDKAREEELGLSFGETASAPAPGVATEEQISQNDEQEEESFEGESQ